MKAARSAASTAAMGRTRPQLIRWRVVSLALFAMVTIVVVVTGATPSRLSGREAIENIAITLDSWIWPFMGAAAFLETTIPPLSLFFPGEWALLFGGAVAGQGAIPIVPLVLLVWVCSAAGDSVSFLLGRRFGRGFLLRYGASLGVNEARLARVDTWFDRYGSAAVALGRLVNFVRPLAPILAGSTQFPYRRFLPWNLLGTGLFSLVYCLLGYFFYRSYDDLVAAVGRGSFAVLAAVAVAGAVAVRLRRGRRRRDS